MKKKEKSTSKSIATRSVSAMTGKRAGRLPSTARAGRSTHLTRAMTSNTTRTGGKRRVKSRRNGHITSKPKTYWMVNTRGHVVQAPISGKKYVARLAFGDVFTTEEDAGAAQMMCRVLFRLIRKEET